MSATNPSHPARCVCNNCRLDADLAEFDASPDAASPPSSGEAPAPPKMFPIQGPTPYREIPWWLAEEAYGVYSSRYGTQQSLARLAERGGFGASEMDMFRPGWRDRLDRVKQLEARLSEVSERNANQIEMVESAREERDALEIECSMLRAQVAALTTERDGLASMLEAARQAWAILHPQIRWPVDQASPLRIAKDRLGRALPSRSSTETPTPSSPATSETPEGEPR